MQQNNDSILLYFVLKPSYQSEEDANPDMKEAFKNAINWSLKSQWINESDCLKLDNQLKGQVFVFEQFQGDTFSQFVESFSCRVIGPKCLLTCFSKQIPIPLTKYPVFNMAMADLTISVSKMHVDDKIQIEKLVGFMGGHFSNALTTSTTHLVVDSVISEKYFKACEEGVQVMKKSWVEKIWKENLIGDIEATDNDILEECKCPIFYNLSVTASTLSECEKNRIKKLINENGGVYSGEMTRATNVLILPVGKGQKFKYAERWKIKCLDPAWVDCCMQKGYAVRYDGYIIRSEEKKCSTPLNTCHKMSLINANDTDISVIPSDSTKNVVGESVFVDTQLTNPSSAHNNIFKTPVKCSRGFELSQNVGNIDYKKILNDIVLTDVKNCGPLLDGCNVYLVGFNANEEEKLRRILNYGGAIRFTEVNELVTHVIVGNPSKNDLQNMKSFQHKPHIVTLEWLSSSIKKGSLEKESNYLYFVENKEDVPQTSKVLQQPSPLSKKGLQMLNAVRMTSENSHQTIGVDQNLIEKYSHVPSEDLDDQPEIVQNNETDRTPQDVNQENVNNDELTIQNSVENRLFSGLKFAIVGHNQNATEYIKKTVLDLGGSVSVKSHRVDYTVVPAMGASKNIGFTEIVTSIWMEECLNENKIVDIKYYHRPMAIPEFTNESPLSACIITFSSYNVCERQYLENVASSLGAKCQDVLSKKENPERGIARTTHLVCASAQGTKYNAAKKWNLPIINEKWLLDSLNACKMLPLDAYLLYEYKDNQNVVASSTSTTKTVAATSNSFSIDNRMRKDNNNCRPAAINESINRVSGVPMPQNDVEETSDTVVQHLKPTKPPDKVINARRLTYAIPTLAEAVSKSADKAGTYLNDKLKAASEIKNLPTGLLAEINRETSSSNIKRKLDDESSSSEAAKISSPRRKILRSDSANMTTSSYEEVGWQDTLTDINHDQLGSNSNRNDAAKSIEKLNNREAATSSSHDANNRLANHCTRNNQDIVQGNDVTKNDNQLAARHGRNTRRNSSTKTHWNMMISIANNEKRQQYENIIGTLGGRILSKYEPESVEAERVTHLIIDELKKTEKLLCSIASGLWVLHSSYLNHCKDSGRFINEEQFEWGNPSSKNLPVKESRDYSLIARAAHRWRKLIQNEGPSKRPFVGMRVVIISSSTDESVQSLMRVVRSGGGTLIPSTEILKATHCLVKSAKNLDNLPVPMKKLAERKIHCLPAIYLSDYLMNDPPPKPELCYFDVYKRCF